MILLFLVYEFDIVYFISGMIMSSVYMVICMVCERIFLCVGSGVGLGSFDSVWIVSCVSMIRNVSRLNDLC